MRGVRDRRFITQHGRDLRTCEIHLRQDMQRGWACCSRHERRDGADRAAATVKRKLYRYIMIDL